MSRAFVLGKGMSLCCTTCIGRGLVVAFAPMRPAHEDPTPSQAERDTRTILRALSKHLAGLAKAHEGYLGEGLTIASDVAKEWSKRENIRGEE